MNLILIEPEELGEDGRAVLCGRRARHIREVLAVAPGDRLCVGLLDGPLGQGEVEASSVDEIQLRCVFVDAPPPRSSVDLLLALPRPKVLRRLFRAVATLGVDRLMLTNACKTERNYFDTHFLRPEVFRGLLFEGLEQARDTRLPRVSVHKRLRVLVEDELDGLSPDTLRLVAHPGASGRLRDQVPPATTRRCLLAVGPEGGWIDREVEMLGRAGFRAVSMGPRILSSDLACAALLTLVHDARAQTG